MCARATPPASAAPAAKSLGTMPPPTSGRASVASRSAASSTGTISPASFKPGVSESRTRSLAPTAAAIAAATSSALTLSSSPSAVAAMLAITGVRPCASSDKSSEGSTLSMAPTAPNCAACGCAETASVPPSSAASPTESTPCARSAATRRLFASPASTAVATSSVAGSVTRRPCSKRASMPSRAHHAVTSPPPP